MVQSKVSNFQVDENYLNVPLVFSKLTLKTGERFGDEL